MGIDLYIDEIQRMRMNPNRISGQKSPHKPVMLLAVIDLIASGATKANRIEYGPDLLEHFRRYFDAVKADGDSCTPLNPFWHLKTSSFWNHILLPSKDEVYKHMGRPKGPNVMAEVVAGVRLDEELFSLLQNPTIRNEIREAIITNYFPSHYEVLMKIAAEEDQVGLYSEQIENTINYENVKDAFEVNYAVRDLAFSRIVKRAYHYQCAACGLRVLFDGVSLVDAAHIVPFSVSHDDDPRNGLSLCKNHHWAMDQELIFPCTDNKWRVHSDLDERLDSQRSLIALDGKSIILPEQEKYAPKSDSLKWREGRLKWK